MLQHLLDGILFGVGFAIINVPVELWITKFKKKRNRNKKLAILRLIKNSR